MEFTFCTRILSALGTKSSLTMIKKMRLQRRMGEVCFAIVVPSFTISAGSLAYIKANAQSQREGLVCLAILTACGVMVVWMMITSVLQKKKVEHDAKWTTRSGGSTINNNIKYKFALPIMPALATLS